MTPDHPSIRSEAAAAQEIDNLESTVRALDARIKTLRVELREALSQRDGARARAEGLQGDINAARFWADEFSADSLEETVWNLYAYVLHWHRAADRLAGGRGRALGMFPPPSSEKLKADLAEAREEALGRAARSAGEGKAGGIGEGAP